MHAVLDPVCYRILSILSFYYHPPSGVVIVLITCLSLCNTISFKSFDVESFLLVCGCVFGEYVQFRI